MKRASEPCRSPESRPLKRPTYRPPRSVMMAMAEAGLQQAGGSSGSGSSLDALSQTLMGNVARGSSATSVVRTARAAMEVSHCCSSACLCRSSHAFLKLRLRAVDHLICDTSYRTWLYFPNEGWRARGDARSLGQHRWGAQALKPGPQQC
jgi:hypothetical protein